MNIIFELRQSTYNLRNFQIAKSQNSETKKSGLNSIAYRASQLWKNVPEEIKNSISLPSWLQRNKKDDPFDFLFDFQRLGDI